MEKERNNYPLKSGNSKVYAVNETNREKIDCAKQKMYSTDKKFVLIYDDDDRKKMELFWEFVEWGQNRGFSREDQIYDSFLSELDPLDKSAVFKEWRIIAVYPDKNGWSDDIRPVDFESEEISISCSFSRPDAIAKGAEPVFGTIPEDKDGKAKGFATIQIMTDIEFGRTLKSASDKGNKKMKEEGTNE
ncbi:MAG TPA: hypothetical protein PK340_01135 [Bacilli bacterium]|nr:hypothetical protein [Bacilli bacterium]